MSPHSSDIIVIGAGIAGLTAAARLSSAGRHVTILEARDRIGGRIETIHPEPGVTVELGAEFLHGKHPLFVEELKQAQLKAKAVDYKSWCFVDELFECDFFERVDSVLEQMPRFASPDRSFEEFLDELSRQQEVSAEDRKWALGYIRGFDGADPGRVGVRSLVRELRAEEKIDGDKPLRLVDGFGSLIEHLRDKSEAETLLNTKVSRVDWNSTQVIVSATTNGNERAFHAPNVVVTLPLGVLQLPSYHPGYVEFAPALTAKRRAFACLAMGNVARVSFLFREKFWHSLRDSRGKNLSKLGFLFSHQEFFPTWWTRPAGKLGLLTGWTPDPSASFISRHRQPREYAIARALESLSQLLPVTRAELDSLMLGAYVHDWVADPFSRGAYSYVAAGGDGVQEELAAPLKNKLFFAGEATEMTGHHATVHGAFLTGLRAADEILKTKNRSLHFADSR